MHKGFKCSSLVVLVLVWYLPITESGVFRVCFFCIIQNWFKVIFGIIWSKFEAIFCIASNKLHTCWDLFCMFVDVGKLQQSKYNQSCINKYVCWECVRYHIVCTRLRQYENWRRHWKLEQWVHMNIVGVKIIMFCFLLLVSFSLISLCTDVLFCNWIT
jgi:hypothetical protein